LAAALLATCGDAGRAQVAAENATRDFHELLRQGRYEDIYRDADSDLRAAQAESTFVAYLGHAAAQLAGARESHEVHVGVVIRDQFTTVILVYEIELGQQTLSEEIWWRVKGDSSRLLDYRLGPRVGRADWVAAASAGPISQRLREIASLDRFLPMTRHISG
jgi:hypothetical protein